MLKVVDVTRAAEPTSGFVPVHRQARTSIGVEVDEGIRDLLEALWAHGMSTEFSCQGNDAGMAHICFARISDAMRFAAGPGDLEVTAGKRRAWVDFPAAGIDDLTRYWSDCGPSDCAMRTRAG